MGEKAREGPLGDRGYRGSRPMDRNFPQQTTASGLLLGRSSAASDSREAWKLLARARALAGGMWVEGR
eukprot:8459743-Alexandrium_andersonii.AAC.1